MPLPTTQPIPSQVGGENTLISGLSILLDMPAVRRALARLLPGKRPNADQEES